MLDRFKKKLPYSFLVFCSIFILLGILIGSIFVRFSDAEVLDKFSGEFANYFSFSNWTSLVALLFKEYFFILLMMLCVMIPYGQIATVILLVYKGFSIGIVSAIACLQYGLQGIWYVAMLILPPNLIYFLALSIAAFITYNALPSKGEHLQRNSFNKKKYILCFALDFIGCIMEFMVVPMIYKTFF